MNTILEKRKSAPIERLTILSDLSSPGDPLIEVEIDWDGDVGIILPAIDGCEFRRIGLNAEEARALSAALAELADQIDIDKE